MKLSEILKKRNSVYDESDGEYEELPEVETPAPKAAVTEKPIAEATATSGSLRMKVIRPREFSEATKVADCLKSGHAVVLNLEDMENTSAKRMIDYLAGVLYAVDGKLERPAQRTFLLTPSGVSVASEDMAQLHPEK